MAEAPMFFDSESLEPSLFSPAPLMASGGDIDTLCDQYLGQRDVGSCESFLHTTLAALLSVDDWQEDFVCLEDHQSALIHGSDDEEHRDSAESGDASCDLQFGLQDQSRGFVVEEKSGFSYLTKYIPEDPCWNEVCMEPGNLQELPTSATFDEASYNEQSAPGSEFEVASLVEALADLFWRMPSNRNRDRRPKSWEFVLRLLADSRTNPTLIRWENQELGTFRLVRPHVIAKIFGTVFSGKPNLSYVNFARDLRHFYRSGVLQAVRTRQLVYRCGPAALAYLRTLQQEHL